MALFDSSLFDDLLLDSDSAISPSGIASRRAFGTPTLTLQGVLYPSSVASRRAFGGATVTLGSGVLYPSGVASRRALGTPSMAQAQTVTVTASVASHRAFGTPAITFPADAQTISPSGIASRRAFGSAGIFSGGLQTLLPGGVLSRRAFGFPALLQAGSQPLRCFIAGKNSFLSIEPAVSWNSRMGGRSTANFQLQWPEGSTPIWPLTGQSVKLTENFRTLWTGFLQEVTTEVLAGTDMFYRWECTAIDNGVIADRRTVEATYEAGQVKPHILDAVARFLTGENVTTNNVTTRSTIAQARPFHQKTFAEFMNQLCSETGDIWFIDEFNDLNCFAPGEAGAAPFTITTGAAATVYAGLKVKRSLIGVATQVFVRSDQNLGE